VALASVLATLGWLAFSLMAQDVVVFASVQVGPGLVSALDVYLLSLFCYICFTVAFPPRGLGRGTVRYLRVLIVALLWLSVLGVMWGNATKDIVGDWKRVLGLFGGGAIGVLLLRSRLHPRAMGANMLGFIPLVMCAFEIARGMSTGDEYRPQGSYGLYVACQTFIPWLGVLLSGWFRPDGRRAVATVSVVAAAFVVPGLGARAIALGAVVTVCCVSLLWLKLWWSSSAGKPGRRNVGTRSVRRLTKPGGPLVAVALSIAVLLAMGLSLAYVDRYTSIVERFGDRFASDNTLSQENINIRLLEIAEMRQSMTPMQNIIGRGLGATYYFSIADAFWVPWGLYTTAFLPAPHILIGWLFLKGGLFCFIGGGVLVPLVIVWQFLAGLVRRDPFYLLYVAPLDIGLLAMFAMLYASVHYDALPLVSVSLIATLRLSARNQSKGRWIEHHSQECVPAQ
jgi:hypothetical protein